MRMTSPRNTWNRLRLRRPILGAMAFVVLFSFFGCGKKDKADDASFQTLPESPIVITADSLDWNGNKVKQPWFSFRVNSVNGTGDTYTLLALAITVMGIDKSGALKSTELGAVPGDFSITLVSGMTSYRCIFTNFGVWTPGADQKLMLKGDTTSLGANLSCDNDYVPVFTIGDNPSGPSGKSFIYNVKVKPLGWFGNYDNPTDRFETSFKFRTK